MPKLQRYAAVEVTSLEALPGGTDRLFRIFYGLAQVRAGPGGCFCSGGLVVVVVVCGGGG